MKLSNIKGERVFDVIADIIDPIANIAEDKEAAALFRREKLPDGMTPKQFLAEKAKKSAAPLLHDHKKDLIAILASIGGVSPWEYTQTLTLAKLMADLIELLTDDAFTNLFPSAQIETGDQPSDSAQESTKEVNE